MTVIVVSGAPATGKSTIAAALAAELRWPLLPLDPLKETLADALGLGDGPGDETWPGRLGNAAATLISVTALRLGACLIEVGEAERAATTRAVAAVQAALPQ